MIERASVATTRGVLIVILLCLSPGPLVGCRTVIVDATRDEAAARAPKAPADAIEVFRDQPPQRAFTTIGTVRAKVKLSPYRERTWPDDRVLAKMQARARTLGADALVDLRVENLSGGGNYLAPDGVFRQGSSQLWIASALVWIDGD
jgi:hypothetical protein